MDMRDIITDIVGILDEFDPTARTGAVVRLLYEQAQVGLALTGELDHTGLLIEEKSAHQTVINHCRKLQRLGETTSKFADNIRQQDVTV